MKKFIIFLYIFIFTAFITRSCFLHKNDSTANETVNAIEQKQYDIYIDLAENDLSLFLNGVLVKTYPVASGKSDTPSPAGIWKITGKDEWGDGFGGSWMGLNVPWGTYGIHGTESPWSIGSHASHGCIRMYNNDAEEVWNIVPYGTIVVIVKGPYSPIGKNPRLIIPGDRGSDVLAIQKTLKKLGFYKGATDGVYGDMLKFALFRFQESKGIGAHNEITQKDLRLMGIFPFE